MQARACMTATGLFVKRRVILNKACKRILEEFDVSQFYGREIFHAKVRINITIKNTADNIPDK